jgi:hypothetical protein
MDSSAGSKGSIVLTSSDDLLIPIMKELASDLEAEGLAVEIDQPAAFGLVPGQVAESVLRFTVDQVAWELSAGILVTHIREKWKHRNIKKMPRKVTYEIFDADGTLRERTTLSNQEWHGNLPNCKKLSKASCVGRGPTQTERMIRKDETHLDQTACSMLSGQLESLLAEKTSSGLVCSTLFSVPQMHYNRCSPG